MVYDDGKLKRATTRRWVLVPVWEPKRSWRYPLALINELWKAQRACSLPRSGVLLLFFGMVIWSPLRCIARWLSQITKKYVGINRGKV